MWQKERKTQLGWNLAEYGLSPCLFHWSLVKVEVEGRKTWLEAEWFAEVVRRGSQSRGMSCFLGTHSEAGPSGLGWWPPGKVRTVNTGLSWASLGAYREQIQASLSFQLLWLKKGLRRPLRGRWGHSLSRSTKAILRGVDGVWNQHCQSLLRSNWSFSLFQ